MSDTSKPEINVEKSIDELTEMFGTFVDTQMWPKIAETHKSVVTSASTFAVLAVSHVLKYMMTNWPEGCDKPDPVAAPLVALHVFEDVAHKLAAQATGFDVNSMPPGASIRVIVTGDDKAE